MKKRLNRQLGIGMGMGIGVAGVLAGAPLADGAIVQTGVNVRLDPADPTVPTSPSDSNANTQVLELNLDGMGTADLTLIAIEGAITDTTGKATLSDEILLGQEDTQTAVQIVQDSGDSPGSETYAEDLAAGAIVGPAATYFDVEPLSDMDNSRELLAQEYSESSSFSGSSGALSVASGETEDGDADGFVDGPVFIGFRIDAGAGSFNYGFIQLDMIDSDDDVAESTVFDNELTVVGFALETTPDTAIETFDVIPEPTTGAVLVLGGLALAGCRRRRSA